MPSFCWSVILFCSFHINSETAAQHLLTLTYISELRHFSSGSQQYRKAQDMPWFLRRRRGQCVQPRYSIRLPKRVKRSGRGGKRLTLLEGDEGISMVAKSQPKSLLLNLPREIRDYIWHECLGGRRIILDIDDDDGWSHGRLHQSTTQGKLLSLALSCRQG